MSKLVAFGVLGGATLYFLMNASSASASSTPAPTGMSGPGIPSVNPITNTATLPDGRAVYLAQNVAPGYNTNVLMIASDGEQRYIPTASTQAVNIAVMFDPSQWETYPVTSGYSLVA